MPTQPTMETREESSEAMEVHFWGTRGSMPTPRASHLGVGGNTACVEVRLAGKTACILDLGTGARELGLRLVKDSDGAGLDLHILFSHVHWDHIQGMPFFRPLYGRGNHVTCYGSDVDGAPLDLLAGQMKAPYFPVAFRDLEADIAHVVLNELTPTVINGLTVTAFPVHHTQFVYGYRISAGGSTLVYCTDYEHGNRVLDALLIEMAAGADLLICDAQYTPQEYRNRVGWGHTTWEHATARAAEAGVRRLALFHHDPSHDDAQLHGILDAARSRFPETILAVEGESIGM